MNCRPCRKDNKALTALLPSSSSTLKDAEGTNVRFCAQGRNGLKQVWGLIVPVLAGLAFCTSSGAAAAGPTVWVVPGLARVGMQDVPPSGSSTQAVLWTARNEYESFQIVVRATGAAQTNVRVSLSDLVGPGGQTISQNAITLYREKYVYVSQGSPDLKAANRPLGAGYYADGLIPVVNSPLPGATLKAFPFSLAMYYDQPIWVDILTPSTATPGQYRGTFTVTSDQGSVSGSVVLNVWHFTLPVKPTLKSNLSYGNGSWGSQAKAQELLNNRLSPGVTPASNQRGLIDSYGLNSTNLGFWSGANASSCTMSAPPSVATIVAQKAAMQSDLYIYNYTADETGQCTSFITPLQQWAQNLHAAGVKSLVTVKPQTALYDDGTGTGRSAVDIWALLPLMYDQAAGNVADVLAKGDAVWSYNALSQDGYSPKWLMDYAPINFRIQSGFISESLSLTGLLYWKVDRWSSDPWSDVNNVGVFAAGNNYPGDGMLVYPGTQVGLPSTSVAPSMRLKWLRDGVEDYEYVELLKKVGSSYGAWALQVAQSVGPDWVNWTRDAAALEIAREQLGNELDLIGSSTTLPPPPGTPTTESWKSGMVLGPTDYYSEGSTRNYRVIIPAGGVAYSGSQIRITVKASPSAAGVIGNVFIGPMSTDGTFDQAPVQITWDGGGAGTTVAAGTKKVSDPIAFAFDKTKRYGIHFYCPKRNFAVVSPAPKGWGFYRSNTDSPSTGQILAPASTFYTVVYGITQLDVLQ